VSLRVGFYFLVLGGIYLFFDICIINFRFILNGPLPCPESPSEQKLQRRAVELTILIVMAPVNQPERLHVPLICKPARCRWKCNNSPAVKSNTSRRGNSPLASHTTPSQCPNDHDRRRQLCWSCRLNANHPREKHAVRGVLFFLARSLPFRNLQYSQAFSPAEIDSELG
jgi:hypothetical protein